MDVEEIGLETYEEEPYYPLEPHTFYLAIKELADRCLKYDLNAIVAIVGEQGSGKSSLALRMAEILREWGFDFDVSRVYFDPQEFVQNAGEPRTVNILEEAGVTLYARNFMSEINKVLSYISQTIRFKNSVTIMTMPHFKLVDKNQRMLVTHVWRTEAIFTPDGVIRVASAYRPETNYIGDQVRISPLRVKNKGSWYTVRRVQWGMPDKQLWEEYLKLKEEVWNEWMEKWSSGKKRRKKTTEEQPQPRIKERLREILEKDQELRVLLLNPLYRWTKPRAEAVKRLAKQLNSTPTTINIYLNELMK